MFLPDVSECLAERLHSSCSNIIQTLLDSRDGFLSLITKPAKCLDDYLFAGGISEPDAVTPHIRIYEGSGLNWTRTEYGDTTRSETSGKQ